MRLASQSIANPDRGSPLRAGHRVAGLLGPHVGRAARRRRDRAPRPCLHPRPARGQQTRQDGLSDIAGGLTRGSAAPAAAKESLSLPSGSVTAPRSQHAAVRDQSCMLPRLWGSKGLRDQRTPLSRQTSFSLLWRLAC